MTRTPRLQKTPNRTTPDRTNDDRRHQAALAVSTRQIAKDAVRGGPKSVKKDKRPTGRGQKG